MKIRRAEEGSNQLFIETAVNFQVGKVDPVLALLFSACLDFKRCRKVRGSGAATEGRPYKELAVGSGDTLVHFFGSHIFFMSCYCPDVSKWIFQSAGTITIELILECF